MLLGLLVDIDIIVYFELVYCLNQQWQHIKNVPFRDMMGPFDN